MSIEAKLTELGIELPPAPKAVGVYKPSMVVGNLVYFSGHGPLNSDGKLTTGRIGDDLDQQAGYDAARQTGLAILATMKRDLGSLDRIVRIVKLFGMVCSTPDFFGHPAVINGCSELYAEVFGPDNGVGVRSAIGVPALPAGMCVEIEGVFEIKE